MLLVLPFFFVLLTNEALGCFYCSYFCADPKKTTVTIVWQIMTRVQVKNDLQYWNASYEYK